jgi:hypothetical protein
MLQIFGTRHANSMTEAQKDLLEQLLRGHHISLRSIDSHLELFSHLSMDEQLEVLVAKAGLFKPSMATAKKLGIVDDRSQMTPVIDFVSLILSIDMYKRPSQYSNRKWVGETFPDFTQAFIDSKKRKKRSSPKSDLIKRNFYQKIKNWRDQNISWRTIAEAINQSQVKVKISHTQLKRIYDSWE